MMQTMRRTIWQLERFPPSIGCHKPPFENAPAESHTYRILLEHAVSEFSDVCPSQIPARWEGAFLVGVKSSFHVRREKALVDCG